MKKEVEDYLTNNSIAYTLHTHPPVFTVEESSAHCAHIPGLHCKNLFLHDDKSNQFYLVVMPAHDRLNIKVLQSKLRVKKLRFAKEEDLWSILQLKPGSVSPLGLMNDTGHKAIGIISQKVWDADIVGFHPNDNAATLEMKQGEFHKLMNTFANEQKIIDLSE
jgi:Ala-tRNA(Pro) deacylase